MARGMWREIANAVEKAWGSLRENKIVPESAVNCCRILFRIPRVERRNKWLFEVLMLTIKLRNGSLVIGGRFRKVAPKCGSFYVSGITEVTESAVNADNMPLLIALR